MQTFVTLTSGLAALTISSALHAEVLVHYSFDTDFTDSSGYANHGVVYDHNSDGSLTVETDAAELGGGGMRQGDRDDRLDLTTAFMPADGTPWTIGFFADLVGEAATYGFDSGTDNFIQVRADAENVVRIGVGGEKYTFDSSGIIRQNTDANHYVIIANPVGVDLDGVLGGDKFTVYANGQQLTPAAGQDLTDASVSTAITVNQLGDSGEWPYGAAGDYDEFWIFDQALTAPQVSGLKESNQIPSVLYVNASTTALLADQDGHSWATAFADVQDALGIVVSNSGQQIWVAGGVYYPHLSRAGYTTLEAADRDNVFSIPDGVSVYGGFSGTETNLSERDVEANITVFSGDVDMDDAVNSDGILQAVLNESADSDNAGPVVMMDQCPSSLLDGLVVTAGANLWLDYNNQNPYVLKRNGGGGVIITNGGTLRDVDVKGCASREDWGNDSDGGGVYVKSGTVLIEDCEISGNEVIDDSGGGVYVSNGNVTIKRSLVSGNKAGGYGGGLGLGAGTLVLDAVSIKGNDGSLYGGGVYHQGGTLNAWNCLLSGNEGLEGGGIHTQKKSVWTNCTIASNWSRRDGGAVYVGAENSTFNNCIIWGNGSGYGTTKAGIYVYSGSVTASNSCVQSSVGNYIDGGSNQTVDPLLVSAPVASSTPTVAGDYQLNGNSPYIDAGNNSADLDGSGAGTVLVSDLTEDLSGGARVVDTRGAGALVDAGAYEFQSIYATGGSPSDITLFVDAGAQIDAIVLSDFVDGAVDYSITDYDDEDVATATVDANGNVDMVLVGAGSTYFEFTMTGHDNSSVVFTVNVEVLPRHLRVNHAKGSPGSAEGGATWDYPMANLNEALAVWVEGQDIWLAKGEYFPDDGLGFNAASGSRDDIFEIPSGVQIYGGFSGVDGEVFTDRDPANNITVLSGDIDENDTNKDANGILIGSPESNVAGANSRRVVLCQSGAGTTIIDGVTITAAHADGATNDDGGAGMKVEGGDVQLTNVNFTGNWNTGNSKGAGLQVANGTVQLTGCSIRSNTSTQSNAGLYTTGGTTALTQCFIENNSASDAGGVGQEGGSLTLEKCYVRGNSASQSGGGLYVWYGGNLIIKDSLISGNRAALSGGGVYHTNGGAWMYLTNTTVASNYAAGSGAGGVSIQNSSAVTVTNTIVSGNGSASGVANFELIDGQVLSDHSLLEGVTFGAAGGAGDTGGSGGSGGGPSPEILDVANSLTVSNDFAAAITPSAAPSIGGDYQLVLTSAALDAGNSSGLYVQLVSDLLGGYRERDGDQNGVATIDMGAFELQSLNAMEQWRDQYGLSIDGSEDNDDLAGDGFAAVLKYAFNMGDPNVVNRSVLDPSNPEAGGLPVLSEIDGVFTYSYLTPVDENISVFVEASRTLASDSWEYYAGLGDLVIEATSELLDGGKYRQHQIKLDTSKEVRIFFRSDVGPAR